MDSKYTGSEVEEILDKAVKVDGSGNVNISGDIGIGNGHSYKLKDTKGDDISVVELSSSNNIFFGRGLPTKGYNSYIDALTLIFRAGKSINERMRITSSGIGVGTTTPRCAFDVNGDLMADNLYTKTEIDNMIGDVESLIEAL